MSHDEIIQGMQHAQQKSNQVKAPEVIEWERGLMRQLDEIRTVRPYTPPVAELTSYEPSPDNGPDMAVETKKAAVLAMRGVAFAVPIAGAAGLYTVLASGALNVALGWIIGGLAGVWIIGGLVSAAGGNSGGVERHTRQGGNVTNTTNITVINNTHQ